MSALSYDAVVVTVAVLRKAVIWMGNGSDMERLVSASGQPAVVIRV